MSSFALSPGVTIQERDLTHIVPAVSASAGAFAGVFPWGPVLDVTQVVSENELAARFGVPTDENFPSFYTPANFLSYSSNIYIVRADTEGQKNAVVTKTGSILEENLTIDTPGTGYLVEPTITFSAPDVTGGIQAEGEAIIDSGELIDIIVTEPGTGYTSVTVTVTAAVGDSGSGATVSGTVTESGIKINNQDVYEDNYINGGGVVGEFAAKYPGKIGNSITVHMCDDANYDTWMYAEEFDSTPGAGFIHILLTDDNDGTITGVKNGVIEKMPFLSKASNGRRSDGTNVYYKDYINNNSDWIYWMDHPESSDWGKEISTGVTFTDLTEAFSATLTGGEDDFDYAEGDIQTAYQLFDNVDQLDISLIAMGKASAVTVSYVIDNVAHARKDCVVFASPQNVSTGEVIRGTNTSTAETLIEYRDALPSTSYAVLDSGFKYQYDRYNDVFRWVPMNGDVAGLCARTDHTNDPWYSPGGFNRGNVQNVVKLAFNPNQAARDALYKKGINPIVSFPGQGTVLYGDKTLLADATAFDRINVRRLFITLEKSIATAAKAQLFEFNDDFTRAQFRGIVEPYLRDVQGRRGITDFRVVCDETNNTGEVIDRNEFKADIYIKPARSINFVSLTFVATRTSVAFEEVA